MTFAAYADQWETQILPLRKPATIATCRSHLRMLKSALGPILLSKLHVKQVQAFFTLQAQSKTAVTVKNIWLTLHQVLAAAVREGLLTSVPKPTLPRKQRVAQEWLSVSQMRDLIQKTDGEDKAFYALLAETGMRIGEALGLRSGDVDFVKKTITIRQSVFNGRVQAPKTLNSTRTLCISGWLAGLLGSVPPADGYLFRTKNGTPWWPAEVGKRMNKKLVEMGIEPVGFHALRRGCVTMCASQLGMPETVIAQRIGHACQNITFGVYAQHVEAVDREWVEKIAEALSVD